MKLEERVIRRPLESGQHFEYAVSLSAARIAELLGADGCVTIHVDTCMKVVQDPHSGNEVLVQSWLRVEGVLP